jgi:hypothetical protein
MDSCVHDIDGSLERNIHNLESLEFPIRRFNNQ